MARGTEIWVCPRCGFRMDIAPLGLYAEVQCPRCFFTDRVHAQLGNFRLDAVLGVGGMSVVYRAFDVVLHRPLALKVLNDTFRDQPERIERFENESAMMARVRHENVTSVYSAGRAYGQFYIAMELVEGVNLEYMVTADNPMPAGQALDIIQQVAQGLQAASNAGLLHRDMKPGNVLITPEGRAKVIDFGLAMDSREDDTEEIIWATPYYVPPETLERQPEDVRTDIYALGMTLRFLLTGIENFAEPVSSLQALVQCKRKLGSLSKLNPDFALALSDLADHMTAFSPADRPKDYAELLEEIAEVQRELATYKAPSTPEGRHHRRVVKGAVLAASLAIGAIGGYIFAPESDMRKRELIPIEFAEQMRQGDSTQLKALEYLESKQFDAAVDLLLGAARQAEDPCMGAWYAQFARIILGSCKDDVDAAEEAHKLFLSHLENKSKVLPAGEKVFRMLSQMDKKRYPGAREWELGVSEWSSLTRQDIIREMEKLEKSNFHPIIKTMEWYVLSEKASWLGLAELSERCLNNIKAISSLGAYEVLSEILSSSSFYKKLSGARSERSRAEASMRERDFATALNRFQALAKDDRFGERSKQQAQVLYEVCDMAQQMFAVLKRRYPVKFRANTNINGLVKLAKGLSPATRSAVWADSSQEGHPAEAAIDGKLTTRWCADNVEPGHTIVVDFDHAEDVQSIMLHWENGREQAINVNVYADGKMFFYEIKKNRKISLLEMDGNSIDRIQITVNGTGKGQWAGVVEIQLKGSNGRVIPIDPKVGRNDFADELRAVLLMMNCQYEEAFAQMDYILSRQGAQSPFSVIAADWKKRWFGVTEVVDAAPSLPTLPPQVAPPSTSDMPIVGLLKRMSPALRETWIAEKFSLIFMPDGSSPKDERQWTRRGTIYLGSDGQKYDFWDRFNKAYDRENLWGIAGDVLRKEYKPTLEAVAKAFPELIGQMALHSAYYHLSEMSPLVRESLLAELAGLLTLPGNSRSAYTGKPGESNPWDAPIPLREYSDRARFRDSKGAERTVSKYKPNSETSDSVSREKVYIAAYLLGVEKVLALYPNVVSALRKNNPEATKFPVSSPQPYLKIYD